MTLVAGEIADKATGKTTTTAADGSELVVVANIYPVKESTSAASVPNRNPKTASTESKGPVASKWGFAATGKDVSIIANQNFEVYSTEGKKVVVKLPVLAWSDRPRGEKVQAGGKPIIVEPRFVPRSERFDVPSRMPRTQPV